MDFFQTGMGQKFFSRDIPTLIDSLNRVGEELKRANDLKEKELKEKELNEFKEN